MSARTPGARRWGAVAVVASVMVPGAHVLVAQAPTLRGYVQNVPLAATSTSLASGNVSDFTRVRLTGRATLGSVAVDAAYEHAVTLRRRAQPSLVGVGVVPGGGEWLDLQWTLADREHVQWLHRFDRLRIGWSPTGALELAAGRQVISWGTTLVLTPADPFVPFNPADPFREFRAGVDAARARIAPSPLSEIDIVVRPTRTATGEELTALARGLATWWNWELSGWGGSLYGDATVAAAAAGAVGGWAVRAEGVVRQHPDAAVFRGALGIDRQLEVGGRSLYVVLEYQHDGLGAARPEDYVALLRSDTFRRGEHQVFGRDETAVQASYEVHPLWTLAGLWLLNANDGSSLLAPSFAYSAGNDTAISGGLFVGIGDAATAPTRPIASEFGQAGTTGYLSVSWFF